MKKLSKFLLIAILFLGATFTRPIRSLAQDETVDYQVFYDNLAPYGSWVNMDPYGSVWIPNVGPGFAPYASNGYWANTDYGWTWVSDFDWGWAAFHYGRWEHKRDIGWFWIPDYTWGPAWVDWDYGPGYYGWAPLGYGVNIDVALGGGWHPHDRRWCFVEEGYMGRRNIGSYYIPRERNTEILVNMHPITERYNDDRRHAVYIAGPRRDDVARITHKDVKVYNFGERNTPGHDVSGRTINLYRPAVQNRPGPAPKKVEDVHNITPVQQRDDNYRKTQPVELHPQIINTQPHSVRMQQSQQPQPQQQQQPRPQPQQQQRPQPQPQRQQPAPQQRMQSQPQPRMQAPQQAPRMQNNNGGGRGR
jgi:hypothetical protein